LEFKKRELRDESAGEMCQRKKFSCTGRIISGVPLFNLVTTVINNTLIS
jgi:hypothetical protein